MADPSETKKAKGAAAVPAKPTAADLFDATEALASKASLPAEKWRAATVIAILASHGELVQFCGGSSRRSHHESDFTLAASCPHLTLCPPQPHFANMLADQSKPMPFAG